MQEQDKDQVAVRCYCTDRVMVRMVMMLETVLRDQVVKRNAPNEQHHSVVVDHEFCKAIDKEFAKFMGENNIGIISSDDAHAIANSLFASRKLLNEYLEAGHAMPVVN